MIIGPHLAPFKIFIPLLIAAYLLRVLLFRRKGIPRPPVKTKAPRKKAPRKK